MANPTYDQSSIKKMKAPGADLTAKDTAVLSEVIGVHNSTPPNLADGDLKQLQLDDMGNLKMSFGDPAQEALFLNPFLIPSFDEISLSYTGDDMTGVTYKKNDVTVAVIALTYTSSVLTGVKRTT